MKDVLKGITEVEGLAINEQEGYILSSSREGVGTIILNKGEVITHNWSNYDSFVKYAQSYIENEEIDEMVGGDFSFVEVKLVYSYENYFKFLTERGVIVDEQSI